MSEEAFKVLRCNFCKKRFFAKEALKESLIVSCSCAIYPMVNGILYLKDDGVAKEAVEYLINGKEEKALVSLLNLRFLLFLPLYFLLKTGLVNLLGFKNTIRIMSRFSLDKGWAWYLINREKIPSFYYSSLTTGLIREKTDRVVDIGCGVGQALSEFEKRVNKGNLFGIDSSFLNLFLARKFFVEAKTLLVCADIEKGIPLQSSSVNIVHTNDTFHYIERKREFIKESFRILKSGGILAILQTLKTPQENILGISPEELKKLLKKEGFIKLRFYSNATLLDLALKGNFVSLLPKSDSEEVLRDSFSYSCLASKGKANLSLKGALKKINLEDLNFS